MGQNSRRSFLKTLPATAIGGSVLLHGCTNEQARAQAYSNDYEVLDKALAKPVLQTKLFKTPVIIESVELLHYEGNFLCRVRSKDGAEGICVSNNLRMNYLYPIFIKQVAPYFIGKDAVKLDQFISGVYVHKSNYKMSGYPLWVPVATLEFAILDMLGHISGKPMGALIGNIVNKHIGVYRANNNRGKSAEESLERIKQRVEESGARAVKFKVGGRMSDPDIPEGRSEKLIPMVRKAFGDDMVIYADANGG